MSAWRDLDALFEQNSRVMTIFRRAGGDWQQFRAATGQLLADPQTAKEVHLVVTIMSKTAYISAATSAAPYFIQHVWLLSSFINSCREMGARPMIICKD